MDCGLAPRCPNRFLSLDGKLLMDAIYDGDDWVDHYTWRLVGSNDNGDVVLMDYVQSISILLSRR